MLPFLLCCIGALGLLVWAFEVESDAVAALMCAVAIALVLGGVFL